MARYRKRPVIIEAIQFWPEQHPWPPCVIPWAAEDAQPRDMSWGDIDTLEGRMSVIAGDWIITGILGEHYNCNDEIFRMTYETVEEVPA